MEKDKMGKIWKWKKELTFQSSALIFGTIEGFTLKKGLQYLETSGIVDHPS